MLILMQCPEASLVAGYTTLKRQFARAVKRGEHGIQIIAPVKYSKLVSRDRLDTDTQQPVIGENGNARERICFHAGSGLSGGLCFCCKPD